MRVNAKHLGLDWSASVCTATACKRPLHATGATGEIDLQVVTCGVPTAPALRPCLVPKKFYKIF